jgi:CubicO group peptidase (beta-lactamase class C family)
MTAVEGYAWLSNQSLNQSPGLVWDYSNFGSAMAGNISSRIQNLSYGKLLESVVFIPLAMNSSSTVWTSDLENRTATGYRMYAPVPDEGKRIRFNDFWVACGGILSDGEDMGRYAAAYLGLVDTPLKDAINLSLQPRAIRSTDEIIIEQSLFWDTFQLPGSPRIHFRSGETNQYQASLILVRDEKVGIAVLSNAAHLSDHTLESDVGFPLVSKILRERKAVQNQTA